MAEQNDTPPEGFNLDAEKSREEEAAKQGITTREEDPIEEIGDPEEDADEDGSAPDDSEVDDDDDEEDAEDV